MVYGKLGFGAVVGLGLAAGPMAFAHGEAHGVRPIDLAICLDTSGSMDGLIESAKQKLWAIVNDLALAEPAPDLRVALLTYGNNGHAAEDGWVAVQTPFTTDLDLVSEKLFALRTNGGEEYVGRVLHRAGALDWHPSEDALRIAVVAGNESADQDPAMPFRDVCRAIIARGIIVNSIFCGSPADAVAPEWREVAQLTDGHFLVIDQNEGTVVIETPFDQELVDLSAAINTTYLPYGPQGRAGAANQVAQDANAANLNVATAAARCGTKGSALYSCASWDLVDASRDESFDLAAVATGDLPEAMQAMTPEARRAHVRATADRRAAIQAEIKAVTGRRQAWAAEAMRTGALDDRSAFDAAVRRAVRGAQAVAKGFRFADEGE